MSDNPNPYQTPDSQPLGPAQQQQVLEIAKAQRFVCVIILVAIICTIGAMALQQVGDAAPLIILPIQVLVSVGQVVGMYRLGRTVYESVGSGIGMALLAFIPCIGLLALLIVNGKATKILQAHGFRVGLMGADLNQFQ